MTARRKMTWLLVGDAAKAQFYSISAVPLRVKKVPSGTLKSTRKTTHGPEHQPDSLHSAQTSNGRGAHQRHEDVFVEHIAAAVDTAAREHEFDDLFRDIDTRADQLIAANAVGVRPTFPHRYAIEQTKAYYRDCIQTCPRKLHYGAPHHGPHGPEPLPWCSRFKPK